MNGPDDFEDYVARRKPVFRGDDDPLEPPPELDRIVLRQAREAIKADRAEPAYRGAGWGMPVAMAATLLVVFSVFLHLGVQKNEPKGEVTVQTISQNVDPMAPPAPPPASAPAEAPQAAAPDANPVVADLGRSRARDPAGGRGFVSEPEASRYSPAAPPPPVATTSAPGDAGRTSTAAAPSEPVVMSAPPPSEAETAVAANSSTPAWRRDARSWQAKIQQLRAEGKNAEADAEQAEYKRQHRAYAGSPDR